MSDTDTLSNERQLPTYPVRDPNNEQVKYVTTVGNFGCTNGVANITLLQTRHVPTEFPGVSEPDLIVAALLRMDLSCVIAMHDALSQIIEQNTTPPRSN